MYECVHLCPAHSVLSRRRLIVRPDLRNRLHVPELVLGVRRVQVILNVLWQGECKGTMVDMHCWECEMGFSHLRYQNLRNLDLAEFIGTTFPQSVRLFFPSTGENNLRVREINAELVFILL